MGKLQQSWEKPRPEPLSCTHPVFAVVLNPTASMHQQTHGPSQCHKPGDSRTGAPHIYYPP